MPRIAPLPRSDAPPEIVKRYDEVFGEGRDPVAQPGTSTGTPGDWWTTWARVPGILSAFSAYFAVRFLEDGDTFHAAAGVNHERTLVRDDHGRSASFDLWTTCFTPRELRLLCRHAGITVDQVWSVGPGDYRARPPDLEHPEFLLVGTVADRV